MLVCTLEREQNRVCSGRAQGHHSMASTRGHAGRLGRSMHTSAAILGIAFCISPVPWVLELMLPAALPACCCHVPVGVTGAVTASMAGDRARGAIKEMMKLLELLGRCLLRSLPEPGWSPAC